MNGTAYASGPSLTVGCIDGFVVRVFGAMAKVHPGRAADGNFDILHILIITEKARMVDGQEHLLPMQRVS